MAEKVQEVRPSRTASVLWFGLLVGVIAVTVVGVVLAPGPLEASSVLDLVALAIGVVTTGFVIVVPMRMQTGYLRAVARGESPMSVPRGGGEPIEQTPDDLLLTALLVKLAFAETPTLAALVLAVRQGGYSSAAMALVALTLVLFALAYPRASTWSLFARQVEAARTAGPVTAG